MVSMWGTKKPDDQAAAAAAPADVQPTPATPDRPTSRDFTHREPDERSRLLPESYHPPRRDGYLDPDDPAVSPYNLWTVRFIRYLTVLFACVTFIWWVLLLVSIFVSPPGMHTRGSGFTDFSFTCLTLGNLLVALLFFTGPAKAIRITMGIITVLLLVDMILIVSVPRIRAEEGWVGIAAVVWSTVMAGWCVMTDRVVAWGKREEEERLTGRPETRRTLREWLSVFIATTIVVVYIIIVILLTGTLILRAVDAGLEMEGERYMVDGGKYKVHLACFGTTNKSSTPTILLEAGEEPLEFNFEHWVYDAWNNGTIDRYCFWDRPGYAWSDNAPSPHSAGMSADALSEALAVAGEEGPWISVSAGYGSVVARIFAARNFKKVTGIMLIDPLHEDLLHRIGSASTGFVLWGYGILSPLGLRRLAGALFKGRGSADRVYGRSVTSTGKFLKAKLQENLVADSFTKNEVVSARSIQSSNTPLVVVSSGIECGRDKEWARKQEDLSTLTNNTVSWDVVSKAPHHVWETQKGRSVLEKRLGELIKAAKKNAGLLALESEELES